MCGTLYIPVPCKTDTYIQLYWRKSHVLFHKECFPHIFIVGIVLTENMKFTHELLFTHAIPSIYTLYIHAPVDVRAHHCIWNKVNGVYKHLRFLRRMNIKFLLSPFDLSYNSLVSLKSI